MAIETLSDKQKLEKWNEICKEFGWSSPGELQSWISRSNVKFTGADSCLAPETMGVVSNSDNAMALVIKSSGEAMATRVLEIYTGMLTFASTAIEAVFWKNLIERMSKEFGTFVPPELVPKYVREIIKYPKDGNGSLLA
jgi:hypothetical protein